MAFAMPAAPRLDELETPALLLDVGLLERNVARLRDRLARHGVPLRFHAKTAKSLPVSRLAMASACGPIAVSTLKEAEVHLDAGVIDILYAVPVAPGKLAHAAALRRRGADLALLVESVEAAAAVAEAQAREEVELPCWIEIDADGHRSGVRADDLLLLEIAGWLARGGVPCRGVLAHAGTSYRCRSRAEIRAVAERERSAAVAAAEALRAAGHAAPGVSVGSTPTALLAEDLAGVTEVRAGVYVFFDLVMAGLGICGVDEIALSVLTSVIGRQPERHRLIVDAGWMALSRDRGTAGQPVDQGYGLVCDLDGRPLSDLVVTETTQEHGIVARRDGGPFDLAPFPPGTLLRVLPNHACATAAQHGAYRVVRGGREVEAVWERWGGW